MIKLTKEELQQIFSEWYEEYGQCPEDFSCDGSEKSASDTFLDYLKQVRK